MRSSRLLLLAALFGATGVMLGAFGAHLLKARLSLAGTLAIWETAVLYHLIHAVALLVVAVGSLALQHARTAPWLSRAALSWTIGVTLFSSSLYALALGGPKFVVYITPLGGLFLIGGWICVGCAAKAAGSLSSQP